MMQRVAHRTVLPVQRGRASRRRMRNTAATRLGWSKGGGHAVLRLASPKISTNKGHCILIRGPRLY